MVKDILSAIFFVASLIFMFFMITDYMNLPTVYTSNSTGDCVKVEFADGTITNCNCLKDIPRYNAVWVK